MKKETALQMIASGYNVEVVMDILGMDPEELFSILSEVLGPEPVMITWITQCFSSSLIGDFEVSMS